VLGALTPRGFYNIDRAEGAIDHWYGIRGYEADRELPSYKSETIEIQIELLEQIVGWIDAAGVSLREITGDPASIEDAGEAKQLPKNGA
jgi:hypothetical protein